MEILIVRTQNDAIGHVLLYIKSDQEDDVYVDQQNNPVKKIKADFHPPYGRFMCHDKKYDRPCVVINPAENDEKTLGIISHTIVLKINHVSC